MEKDMFPYETIKRGYGGAHYTDIIHFTKRLVNNHNPKAILIFVANDIKGNNKSDIYSKNLPDRKPKEVKRLFKLVINQIRSIHEKFQFSLLKLHQQEVDGKRGLKYLQQMI